MSVDRIYGPKSDRGWLDDSVRLQAENKKLSEQLLSLKKIVGEVCHSLEKAGHNQTALCDFPELEKWYKKHTTEEKARSDKEHLAKRAAAALVASQKLKEIENNITQIEQLGGIPSVALTNAHLDAQLEVKRLNTPEEVFISLKKKTKKSPKKTKKSK